MNITAMDITATIHAIKNSAPAFIGLGFVVGFLSGALGLGGGWLITPALGILGFPLPVCVGTSLTQMLGTSLSGMWKHHRNGNVHLKLGLLWGFPVMVGVHGGAQIMKTLDRHGYADGFVGWFYAGLLFLMGSFLIYREIKTRQAAEVSVRVPLWFTQSFMSRGPQLTLAHSPDPLPIPFTFLTALLIGTISGLLGIGGGFFLVPVMIYLLGIPTRLAVGTSLVVVFMGSLYGSTFYLSEGQVDLKTAGLLLLGAFVGSFLGAAAIQKMNLKLVRMLFLGLILAASIGMALKTMGFELIAGVLVFSGALSVFFVALGSIVARKFH